MSVLKVAKLFYLLLNMDFHRLIHRCALPRGAIGLPAVCDCGIS